MLAAPSPSGQAAIKPVDSAGTDNAIYRLGDDMAVRLPRIRGAVGKVTKNTDGCRDRLRARRSPSRSCSEKGGTDEDYP